MSLEEERGLSGKVAYAGTQRVSLRTKLIQCGLHVGRKQDLLFNTDQILKVLSALWSSAFLKNLAEPLKVLMRE
jgi:hypothetical protein